MNISAMSYSFGGMIERVNVDHPAVVRFFRELGIKAMEIFDPYVDDNEIPAVLDELEKAEMRVCVTDLELDVVSRDADVRKARVQRFQERLEVAARDFKSPWALIVPGLPAQDSDFSVEECHEWLAAAVSESLPAARELGITMTLANLGFRSDIYGRSSHLLSLCESLGSDVKLTYDVGNYVMAGEDSLETLERVFPHVVHVHFKDWEIATAERPGAWPGIDGRLFAGKPLGDGILNLPGILARLKELDYNGYISVEYEGLDDPWKSVERGIAYLRSLPGMEE